jgi:hypothetical protein
MLFMAANELQYGPNACLSTGSHKLDDLLGGGLLPGLITVLHSSKGPKQFRPFLTHFLLQHYGRHPIIIDTVNQLPILQLVQATDRRRHHSQILRKLHIARAFNYHQITEAITVHLRTEIQQTGSSIIILLGLAEQYLSDEAAQNLQYDRREPLFALNELAEALGVLKSLVLEHQLYCVVLTSLATRSHTKTLGGRFLGHCAGVIVQQREEQGETVWKLVEHPSRKPQHTHERSSQNGKRLPQRLDQFFKDQSPYSFQDWVHSLAKKTKHQAPRSLDTYL